MPVPGFSTAGSFYRLKVNINAPKGGLTEVYNLNPSVPSISAAYLIAKNILFYRYTLLAGLAAVVNAVISKQFPVGTNAADGVRMDPSTYGVPYTIYQPQYTGTTNDAVFSVTNTAGVLSVPLIVSPGFYPNIADGVHTGYAIDAVGNGSGASFSITTAANIVTVITVIGGGTGYVSPIIILPSLEPSGMPEPSIDPSISIEWQNDTGLGKVERRQLRCLRSTWTKGSTPTFPIGAPLAPGAEIVPPYAASQWFPTIMLNNYFSYVRDQTVLVLKQTIPATISVPAQFQYAPFVPAWTYQGIGRRALGFAWPRVQGRKPVLA